ncbi:hypothetical protein LINPERHAP1_LOCUS16335, partial [Linum perenne]
MFVLRDLLPQLGKCINYIIYFVIYNIFYLLKIIHNMRKIRLTGYVIFQFSLSIKYFRLSTLKNYLNFNLCLFLIDIIKFESHQILFSYI